MGPLNASADRLAAAVGGILDLGPRVVAGAPWPLAAVYGTEDEASWGPPEVLAHLEEMLPYWLGEAERILDGAGDAPVPFGRVAADPVRIGIIGRDRTLPPRELLARIEADGARTAARMRALSGADAAREGLHPRLGVMTVATLFERFAVTHVEEHVEQLRSLLDSRAS